MRMHKLLSVYIDMPELVPIF